MPLRTVAEGAPRMFAAAWLANTIRRCRWTMTPSGSGVRVMTTTYTLPNSGTLQAVRGQFRYGAGSGPCAPGSFNDRDDLVFAVTP